MEIGKKVLFSLKMFNDICLMCPADFKPARLFPFPKLVADKQVCGESCFLYFCHSPLPLALLLFPPTILAFHFFF